jgi:hypothetical protein
VWCSLHGRRSFEAARNDAALASAPFLPKHTHLPTIPSDVLPRRYLVPPPCLFCMFFLRSGSSVTAFVKSMISAWSDITPAVRGFEVVVLCCLGFRPSLGARTYSPSTSALVPSPCPGSLAFCAGGFQAGDTQLNSEVAPALTEIDWSAVSVSCRRRTTVFAFCCLQDVCVPPCRSESRLGCGVEGRTLVGQNPPPCLPRAITPVLAFLPLCIDRRRCVKFWWSTLSASILRYSYSLPPWLSHTFFLDDT